MKVVLFQNGSNVPYGIDVGDPTLEGYSRAAQQTYWRVLSHNVIFDLGACPWEWVKTDFVAISHGHIDHIGGLATFIANRNLLHMPPPTIVMPSAMQEHFGTLMWIYEQMAGHSFGGFRLVAAVPGIEIMLEKGRSLMPFAVQHLDGAVGYVLREQRRRLRPEFQGRDTQEILQARSAGTVVEDVSQFPVVAYSGDTAFAALLDTPEVFWAKTLILEMTYLEASERAHRRHVSLDDIVQHADRFQNHTIALSHTSLKHRWPEVADALDARLPEDLLKRVVLWSDAT